MKEELEKMAEAAMRTGIDRIRSEKDRLLDVGTKREENMVRL